MAARTIWNLSFDADVKQKIIEEPGCVSAIEKLANSKNQGVKKMAKGAMWKIKGETHKREVAFAGKQGVNDKQQIML